MVNMHISNVLIHVLPRFVRTKKKNKKSRPFFLIRLHKGPYISMTTTCCPFTKPTPLFLFSPSPLSFLFSLYPSWWNDSCISCCPSPRIESWLLYVLRTADILYALIMMDISFEDILSIVYTYSSMIITITLYYQIYIYILYRLFISICT